MEFIEAPLFTRLIYDYMDDTEYSALQIELAMRPEAGPVIPGSGGIRKLRWSGKGKGKGEVSGLSIIGKTARMKYGCLPYTPRMRLKICR